MVTEQYGRRRPLAARALRGSARTGPGQATASPVAPGAAASALPGAQGQQVPAATVVQLLDRSLQGRLGAVVHTSISGRIGVEGAPGRTGVGKLTGTRDNLTTQMTISEEGRSMTVLSTPDALYLKGLMQVRGKVWAKTTAAGNKESAATGPTSVQGVPVKSYQGQDHHDRRAHPGVVVRPHRSDRDQVRPQMRIPASTTSSRSGLRLVAVAAGLALLAGCSGGPQTSGDQDAGPGATGSGLPTSSVSASVDPSASASTSASTSASVPATSLPTAENASIAGAKLADSIRAGISRDRTVTTSVLVTGPLAIVGTGAATTTKKLKLSVSLAGEKDVSVVKTGGRVYLKLPSTAMPGKDWLAVPSTPDDPIATMYATTFEGYETPSDLAATPKVLASLGTYTVGGAEQVNGVPAVKYSVATTANKAAKLLPPAYQPVNPTRMKSGKATVSVWVDGSGRLLRTASTARIPSTKQIKVLIGYTGWGKPVDIAAPPSSQVGKLS